MELELSNFESLPHKDTSSFCAILQSSRVFVVFKRYVWFRLWHLQTAVSCIKIFNDNVFYLEGPTVIIKTLDKDCVAVVFNLTIFFLRHLRLTCWQLYSLKRDNFFEVFHLLSRMHLIKYMLDHPDLFKYLCCSHLLFHSLQNLES